MTDYPIHFRGRRLVPLHTPAILTADAEPWMAEGTCTQPGSDPDAWFPSEGGRGQHAARAAKRVCRECPVVTACLAYALRNNEPYGVFGGTSPQDRAKMRRQGAA